MYGLFLVDPSYLFIVATAPYELVVLKMGSSQLNEENLLRGLFFWGGGIWKSLGLSYYNFG